MNDRRRRNTTKQRPRPPARQGKKPPLPRYKRGGPFSWLLVLIVVFTVWAMLQRLPSDKIGWDDFIQVTVLVILTGILASIYPARKALKMNPSEALRIDM